LHTCRNRSALSSSGWTTAADVGCRWAIQTVMVALCSAPRLVLMIILCRL
jgi:hypothetical protein